jgi:hypothetical protein
MTKRKNILYIYYIMPNENELPEVITTIEQKWPHYTHKKKDVYLYLTKKKDSANHIHIFNNTRKKNWYYNVKCNNNKGKDRKDHLLSKTKKRSVKKMKNAWRKECPQFFSTK